jgi:hypothetical protein
MPPENRRTFVKKSVATSVSISFVGLIRAAHGEGGGGSGTTGIGTYNTSSPLSTGETTDIGTFLTTVPMTIVSTVTTARKICEWVEFIFVLFNTVIEHPEPEHPKKSGRIFGGTLYCIIKNCLGQLRAESFSVETGGYIDSELLEDDSDTGFPPGVYTVERSSKGWGLLPQAHKISDPPGRDAMLVHDPQKPRGSAGCIVITGEGQFEDWQTLMAEGSGCTKRDEYGCPPRPSPVEMSVRYDPILPEYDWEGDPPNGADPYPNPMLIAIPVTE